LPLAATLMMGAMAKRHSANSSMPSGGGRGGGLLDMLTPMLDQNHNGSIIDDMIGRFARPR
jgi:hypothetical protein